MGWSCPAQDLPHLKDILRLVRGEDGDLDLLAIGEQHFQHHLLCRYLLRLLQRERIGSLAPSTPAPGPRAVP